MSLNFGHWANRAQSETSEWFKNDPSQAKATITLFLSSFSTGLGSWERKEKRRRESFASSSPWSSRRESEEQGDRAKAV